MKDWSPQQLAIFERFENLESGNFAGSARAGTGKTTVIVEGVKRAPDASIQICAFNKSIEKEVALRTAGVPRVRTKTLHGIGFGIVMRNWNGIQVATRIDDRANDITEAVTGPRVADQAKKLITKLHNKGREINPHAKSVGDLTDLMYNFDILPDEYLEDMGYEPNVIEDYALKAMEYAASKKPATGIDFADMIFLPCRNRWIRPGPNFVVVDEAQDMSPAQLEIALGIARDRIAVFGDPYQAIYGFRGIDSNTFTELIKKIKAEVLPLTVTYRCPQSVVRLAQQLVPDYTANEDNPEGVVRPLAGEKLVDVAQMNNPVYYDGGRWLFFQAQWDPEGQKWTVLGIGNRPGVFVMIAGCVMIFIGLMYAFYVKPVIIRKMKQKALAEALRKKARVEAGALV